MTRLATADSLVEAKAVLLNLMDVERSVLVKRTGASAAALDKLKKWARAMYYCTAVDGGFIVHATRPAPVELAQRERQ